MSEVVIYWLKVVWEHQPGSFRNPQGMLTLDAFCGHITPKVKSLVIQHLNIDFVIIPGGMTSQLQVLDVTVNKAFKGNLQKNIMTGS